MARLVILILLIYPPLSICVFSVAESISLERQNCSSESQNDGEVIDLAESRLVSELGTSEAAEETKSEGGGGGEEAEVSNGVSEGKEEDQKKKNKSKFLIVVLLMGLWAAIKRAMEKVMEWEWLNLWPFSRQEKRLEKLIVEADANTKDATLQGALLAELNKHFLESVVQRFEQREHAVDNRGVGEYIRSLVITNALAEYLPDEQIGKPSSLPTLVYIFTCLLLESVDWLSDEQTGKPLTLTSRLSDCFSHLVA